MTPETQIRRETLAIAGILAMAAGILALLPTPWNATAVTPAVMAAALGICAIRP